MQPHKQRGRELGDAVRDLRSGSGVDRTRRDSGREGSQGQWPGCVDKVGGLWWKKKKRSRMAVLNSCVIPQIPSGFFHIVIYVFPCYFLH